MKNEGIPSPYMNDLGAAKLVIFMEAAPNSDRFEQLMLTPGALRNVLEAIHKNLLPCRQNHGGAGPCGGVSVYTNEKQAFSFPDISVDYTEEEIRSEDDACDA